MRVQQSVVCYLMEHAEEHYWSKPDLLSTCTLDNSGSDSRNQIGQLQVSKCGRNLERDFKCQWGGF